MRRFLSMTVSAASLLACKPDLPSLDYHGERVRVGSDLVDQVCDGTLNRLDREVEQIETRLDLPSQSSRLDIYIVDGETVEAQCGSAGACTDYRLGGQPFVVVDQHYFERSIAHELVHARLASITSVPLFEEGIAEAASLPSCPRNVPGIEPSQFIAAKDSDQLFALMGSYYVAEELVAWMIEEFGSAAVLNLMRSLEKKSPPATIRAKYREHFDRELDSDLLAHVRTRADLDALPPEHFGCLAAPVDLSTGPVQLVADLDCDSDPVQNNFGVDGSGYVEWTLQVEHEQALSLVGDVPWGTSLTIEECRCLTRKGEDVYRVARPLDTHETLQPGTYRLRWTGELDAGLSLDVELVPL